MEHVQMDWGSWIEELRMTERVWELIYIWNWVSVEFCIDRHHKSE